MPKVQYNCPVSAQRTPDATIKSGISIPKDSHRLVWPAWENLYGVRRPLHRLNGSNLAIIWEGYSCMRGPMELVLRIQCTGGDILGWRTTVWFTGIQVILGGLGHKKANIISALPSEQWPSWTGCKKQQKERWLTILMDMVAYSTAWRHGQWWPIEIHPIRTLACIVVTGGGGIRVGRTIVDRVQPLEWHRYYGNGINTGYQARLVTSN